MTEPEGPRPDKPSKPERDLIEEALGQASPRASRQQPGVDLPPPESFPGYEITREIHRGGQGVVYQAIQKTTKRKVAIKVLHGGPFGGSAGRSRFEREVQVLGQLDHPNIVGIHDSGVTPDGSCYYVMDYISGRTLDEYMHASMPKPDIGATLRLFAKICDAVNAAHLRGVIHRDLKPANIRIDTSGEPIIVDFGLAKIAVPDVTEETHPQLMTMTGQFIGSLPWASPEQAEGTPGSIDVRTDVYSLGVVLYQMLTGRFPYEVVGHMRDVLDNILRAEPARPSTIRRQINDEVETIVLKCLSKPRERRYQSAGEIARDVKHYLAGEPIEAKRDSGWYVITKTLSRYKTVAGAAGAFLVLIVVFAIAMSMMYATARDEQRKAESARNEEAAQRARAEGAEREALLARDAERAQRERAEANFASVLGMARLQMFDLHDLIADLRGSTAARELILKETLAYLEKLRAQGGSDPAFLRQLAGALDRVGDIQGGLYLRKLGETPGAAASFAEARRIREGLLADSPQDPRANADMGISLAKTAGIIQLSGEYAAAAEEFGRAVGAFDRALALAGSTGDADLLREAREARAGAVQAIGDIHLTMAQDASEPDEVAKQAAAARERYDEGASFWLRRLEESPGDSAAARALSVALDRRVMALTLMGTQARARGDRRLNEGKTDEARAELDAALRHFAGARDESDGVIARFEELSTASAASGRLRRDLYIALHSRGIIESESARALESLARCDGAEDPRAAGREVRLASLGFYSRALAITEALAAADEASTEAQRDIAACLNKVGNEQRDLGDLESAAAAFARSAEIRRVLVESDPMQRHVRDLAVGLFKMGEITKLLGDRSGESGDRVRQRERYNAALEWLNRSLAEYTRLRDDGVLSARSGVFAEINRWIEATNKGLETMGEGR